MSTVDLLTGHVGARTRMESRTHLARMAIGVFLKAAWFGEGAPASLNGAREHSRHRACPEMTQSCIQHIFPGGVDFCVGNGPFL